MILAKLVDSNGVGVITSRDIGYFFKYIWNKEENKKIFNQVSKKSTLENREIERKEKQFRLVEQLLTEINLEFYFELIRSKEVDCKTFTQITLESMIEAFPEIEREHCALIFLKVQKYNERKRFYFALREEA